MLQSHINIAFRNLRRNSTYTFTNVAGLGLAIAAAILIASLVRHHLSFDTFHAKADRTYRVVTQLQAEKVVYNSGVPSPLPEALRNDHASILEDVASVAGLTGRVVSFESNGNHVKFEEDVAFADPTFFNIVDFPLIKGNKNTVLKDINTAVITEGIATKYFRNEDPIGKSLRIDDKLDVTITGVLKDLPANTDRRHQIYLPFTNLQEHSPWLVEKDWWFSINRDLQCFVTLRSDVSPQMLDNALSAISEKYYNEKDAKFYRFNSQAIADIHFNMDFDGTIKHTTLWTLSLAGAFLMITACVNFVNLTTTQLLKRSVEIGVRKTLGGKRRQLFGQLMAETSVVALIALILGIVIAQLVLPYLNTLFNVTLAFNVLSDAWFILLTASLLLFTIAVSGTYPGLALATFKPALALKKQISQRDVGGFAARRGLVITQFGISQLLIIATLVIASQMRYSSQADMGFEKDATVMLQVPTDDPAAISTLRTELLRTSGVEGVTFCAEAPASKKNPTTSIHFGSRPDAEKFSITLKAADDHYASVFGLSILAGRNPVPSDSISEYLLNETAVRKLGIKSNEDVIGEKATINGWKGIIVGVVKDFHNKSFHQAIDPLSIIASYHNYTNCAVKVDASNLGTTLPMIEKAWTQQFPESVYKFDFLDDRIERFYQQDRMVMYTIESFSMIALFISSLGLYGMVSFMAARKTKEVGVRKVLGASISSILWIFGKEFGKMLVIAFIIITPLAWIGMNQWLEGYAYRITIGPETFLVAVIISVVITILTVGYMSLRTAMANPVKSLRSE